MGGLISFLGGTAFRWLFGEVVGFFKAKQEHEQEMQRMTLSFAQDKERNQWQREAIKEQAEAGIKVIEAQTEQAGMAASDAAFLAAVQGVNAVSAGAAEAAKRTDWVGKLNAFIVAFNAFIRPELAQVAILLLAAQCVWPDTVVIPAMVMEVFCAVLGVFIGDRIRSKGSA